MGNTHISSAPEPVKRAFYDGLTFKFDDERITNTSVGLSVPDRCSDWLKKVQSPLTDAARRFQLSIRGPYYSDQLALLVAVPEEYLQSESQQTEISGLNGTPEQRYEGLYREICVESMRMRKNFGVSKENEDKRLESLEPLVEAGRDEIDHRVVQHVVVELAKGQDETRLQEPATGESMPVPPKGTKVPTSPEKTPLEPFSVSGEVTDTDEDSNSIVLDKKLRVRIRENPLPEWKGALVSVLVAPEYERVTLKEYCACGDITIQTQGSLLQESDLEDAA